MGLLAEIYKANAKAERQGRRPGWRYAYTVSIYDRETGTSIATEVFTKYKSAVLRDREYKRQGLICDIGRALLFLED